MNLANFESMDPIMLMSIVNMKLRDDFGGDLDKLVTFFDIDRAALEAKLATAGFDFLPDAGQFR
ncbi:DUF4250 domain-containing protein [Vibrio campbellii]|jgi:hypothetical protein|uniref:DUF4250 domain-containing protein n=1 Tax=Vibrio campbellii TaxID=680 RepID=A0AAE9N1K3_9VIBR|nr:DUF4250 domain-containing protein [Vibrio campbellii]ARV73331.1 hypothetical protein A8140_11580 [Vibrio campbellii CAIM 519 = NBRC 15631 = ATCC 25920]ELU53281.1 hypothetical protein B878_03481 [Vibrio campbellii CAIM 519 = NBRC 15631 = ATCC 25920]UTZ22505.1 DUF4250 domain-containing protein [Vibrio campbellii]UTZ27269.1 DUF4250 domain-containing protein [Vibrio campbellii]HDM8043908.1 DUF4250 domain-containing protein [Vibrio campbellii]|tara:strand:+ start:380 stop:571 length:192 start_codon:yes stop_codon:yes gene_type:complete